jgi:dTDP-4-amino-4,6-dideoxygalactose transaminase
MHGNGTLKMPYQELFEFEQALSQFTGAPYVVATNGCTHALELCLRYDKITACEFTAFTYLSVPMLMHRLNITYQLTDQQWIGEYQLHGTRIWDSARLLQHNMYRPGMMQCLSFGNTKPLQLGAVGAILLDDKTAHQTLSRWRSDGRDLRIVPWPNQKSFEVGYHYCPTLELCKLGTKLLPTVDQTPKSVSYNDCRLFTIT